MEKIINKTLIIKLFTNIEVVNLISIILFNYRIKKWAIIFVQIVKQNKHSPLLFSLTVNIIPAQTV